MAYEAEKSRIISEISSAVGFDRTRDSALEREATERALEARNQTGLTYDGPQDIIVHPSAADRQSRLGIPSSVGTSELATWNYLHTDAIGAAINGLLTSTVHRAVLDNRAYDYWGVGIYSEMPAGQTNEIHRRWWIIIWLSTEPIDVVGSARPDEKFATALPVNFSKGTHKGFKFAFDGSVLDTKTVTFGRARIANTTGRGKIPGRTGTWLFINNKFFAGYWVKESGFLVRP